MEWYFKAADNQLCAITKLRGKSEQEAEAWIPKFLKVDVCRDLINFSSPGAIPNGLLLHHLF